MVRSGEDGETIKSLSIYSQLKLKDLETDGAR